MRMDVKKMIAVYLQNNQLKIKSIKKKKKEERRKKIIKDIR